MTATWLGSTYFARGNALTDQIYTFACTQAPEHAPICSQREQLESDTRSAKDKPGMLGCCSEVAVILKRSMSPIKSPYQCTNINNCFPI